MNASTTTTEPRVRRFDETELVASMRSVDRKYGDVDALADTSFEISRNKIYGLLGRNGAGKTTTVKVLSTLIRPTSGRAMVAGYDVVRNAPEVRRSIMMTGQFAALDDSLTGRENIELFLKFYSDTLDMARQ